MKQNNDLVFGHRFHALGVAVESCREAAGVLEVLKACDGKLADQLRRAVQSVALNIGEARGRRGRDRAQHFAIACGSAREAAVALEVAVAFGYLAQAQTRRLAPLLDRCICMLTKLSR